MADAPPRGLVNVRASGEAARRAKKDKRNNIVSLMAEQFERVRVPSLSLSYRFFFILPPAFSSTSFSSSFSSLSLLSAALCLLFLYHLARRFTSEELLAPLCFYSSSWRRRRYLLLVRRVAPPCICVRACPFCVTARRLAAIPQESYQKGNT